MRFTLTNIQQVNLPGVGMMHLKFGVAPGAKHLAGFKLQYWRKSKCIGKIQALYRIAYQFTQQTNYFEPGVFFSMP